ncbi:hypothetical protein SAMN05661080_04998 [Modestobacter sp. DSM 44400]|uniref:DUF6318 family protein n=1 Tax=Modestobacter sp. DSM 44400 TaxID=1550230 RepID=UPI0008976A0C|nr:DUF6318 family protein [Modestobacter sp. DSM 44400]SDY91446.1 hypothetical protein SAMN05661080_04998 [Modestobacter sp. DSM 44400]
MRLARVAAGVLVGAVVLGDCSSKEPANDTLPSASASPTAVSDAPPPLGPPDLPMPVEAREQTPAGADAFLRYYMDVYNAAETSLDPTYMDQLSQDCETCDRLIQNIRQDAGSGYSYEGGTATVTSVSTPLVRELTAETAFSMDQTPLTVRNEQGVDVPELSAPAASLDCGAILYWSRSDSTWIFSQWDVN